MDAPLPPRGIRVWRLGPTTIYAIQHTHFVHFVLTVFCVCTLAAVGNEALKLGPGRLSGTAILATLVALPLLYLGIAGLVNRTTITVEPGRLRIRRGPLPVGSNRDVGTTGIVRLVIGATRPSRDDRNTTLHVIAEYADGRMLKLVDELNDRPAALFLQKELEGLLGLPGSPPPKAR